MTLTVFRDKLFNLQEQKAFTNEEIRFLNLFDTVEQIYNVLLSGANDSQYFLIDEIDISIISNHKTEIESIWLKVLNTKVN